MQTEVSKWGNSLAVRIPAADAKRLGLKSGDRVETLVQDGRFVVQTMPAPVYSLEELIEGITPENRHTEMDWGRDVGKEILDAW